MGIFAPLPAGRREDCMRQRRSGRPLSTELAAVRRRTSISSAVLFARVERAPCSSRHPAGRVISEVPAASPPCRNRSLQGVTPARPAVVHQSNSRARTSVCPRTDASCTEESNARSSAPRSTHDL